jgi:TRAP-type mannitol/chloroaromatic compound transport system substrate-binding protein
MKRILTALAAITAISAAALVTPAQAVPPTATPSPGYDARLQESRGGSATTIYTPAPRSPKPKPKKQPQQ